MMFMVIMMVSTIFVFLWASSKFLTTIAFYVFILFMVTIAFSTCS
jgi:hypothetical protein